MCTYYLSSIPFFYFGIFVSSFAPFNRVFTFYLSFIPFIQILCLLIIESHTFFRVVYLLFQFRTFFSNLVSSIKNVHLYSSVVLFIWVSYLLLKRFTSWFESHTFFEFHTFSLSVVPFFDCHIFYSSFVPFIWVLYL